MPDDVPFVDAQDDVDALPAQEGALVEAVRRATRQSHDREEADEGPLRWRAPEREVELHALRERAAVEATDAARQPLAELPDAGLARHLDERACRTVDLGAERAAVELRQADAAPPPPHPRRQQRDVRESCGRRRRERDRERAGSEKCDGHAGSGTGQVGAGKPDHERRSEHVSRQDARHGTTSGRRSASRAGPMPGIASSPSTEVKGPCACRYSMIFCAVTGPTPGSVSSCSAVAELRETGPVVPEGAPAAPTEGEPRAATSTCSPSASGAARLTAVRSARRASPPARAIASATREPSSNR